MKIMFHAGVGLLFAVTAASPAGAAGIAFTPLASSVTPGSRPADKPFVLAPGWSQQTLFTNQGLHRENGNGNSLFDMIVVNETGADAGRYIFTVNETVGGGLVRYDKQTKVATQLFEGSLNGVSYSRLDPIRWTPWGTIVIGEETTDGRMIEIMNPLAAPASMVVVDRPKIGRSSLEGIAWDKSGAMYYQDEDNGGGIYKFVSSQSAANFDPNNPDSSPLAGGQIFTLRVNAANTEERQGVGEWVALNNADGTTIPGITDPTISARAAGNDVSATNYRRPEDMHLVVRDGKEYLIVAATTADSGTSNHHIYSIELTSDAIATIRSFVDSSTIDLATGLAVDALADELRSPDNIAIDGFGDVWIVEDNEPGDIWKALWGADGIAASVARFASLSALGAEPTGFYFDPFDSNIAYVNVQHPGDLTDRLVQLTFVPEPASMALFGIGAAGLLGALRRRRGA